MIMEARRTLLCGEKQQQKKKKKNNTRHDGVRFPKLRRRCSRYLVLFRSGSEPDPGGKNRLDRGIVYIPVSDLSRNSIAGERDRFPCGI